MTICLNTTQTEYITDSIIFDRTQDKKDTFGVTSAPGKDGGNLNSTVPDT